jgi:hypothetical protein
VASAGASDRVAPQQSAAKISKTSKNQRCHDFFAGQC